MSSSHPKEVVHNPFDDQSPDTSSPTNSIQQTTSYEGSSPEHKNRWATDSASGSSSSLPSDSTYSERGAALDDEGYPQEAETDTEPREAYETESNSSRDEDSSCYVCSIPLHSCNCPRCRWRGNRRSECTCEPCANCSLGGYFCHCPTCRCCGYGVYCCYCNDCAICEKNPHDCLCMDFNDARVAVPGQIMQKVETAQLETGSARARGGVYGETLILRGDLKNSHVLIVRRPSAIVTSVCGSIRESVLSNCSALRKKIKSTNVYKQVGVWYDLAAFHMEPEVMSTHINVKHSKGVKKMVTQLAKIPHNLTLPTIGFDCEGVDLGRYGTTCYIQIRDYTKGQSYLVDLLRLGQVAWNTPGDDDTTTLKAIFENPNIVKIIFDVRGDSDALYQDYKIKLAGVLDVQYLAMLGRADYWQYRVSFVRTMASSNCLSPEEMRQWQKFKDYHFDGDYSVFTKRPHPKELQLYAINDILGVDKLAAALTKSLTQRGLELAFEWT